MKVKMMEILCLLWFLEMKMKVNEGKTEIAVNMKSWPAT